MAGTNRAARAYEVLKAAGESRGEKKPCVFISHINIDKRAAEEIGTYIMKHGDIDIYLDIFDAALRHATFKEDPERITQLIENGLNECGHVLCLVSEDTVGSWWVPYEIGFGKKGKKDIAVLTMKDTKLLPAFLQISIILRCIKSLNEYLSMICKETRSPYTPYEPVYESLINYTAPVHPLEAYLSWGG